MPSRYVHDNMHLKAGNQGLMICLPIKSPPAGVLSAERSVCCELEDSVILCDVARAMSDPPQRTVALSSNQASSSEA
jgi:hypothetical protein